MPTQSYTDKLCLRAGETREAYLERITQSISFVSEKKDKALLLASKAVAVVWAKLDGMANPFTVPAMDDPGTPREIVETAAILMAQAIKEATPALDEMRNPDEKIKGALSALGVKGPNAKLAEGTVRKQVAAINDQTIRTAVAKMKPPFDFMIEQLENLNAEAAERTLGDDLTPLHNEFKAIRKGLYPQQPNKRR